MLPLVEYFSLKGNIILLLKAILIHQINLSYLPISIYNYRSNT